MKKLTFFCLIFLISFLFTFSVFAKDITLRWDANIETDLVGYKLYYRTDGLSYTIPTPPEDIIDQGVSPIIISITDPSAPFYMDNIDPEFILTGLDLSDKDYFFVLTAFDNEIPFNESGFSNEVNTIDIVEDSIVNADGSDSGCFISSVKKGYYVILKKM